MTLRAPHHGYAYQDVITGTAFVDLMLGTATTIKVDLKDFDGDRFDDLTINYSAGHRLRLQIKHTTIDRELARATFSSDKRDLRLDLLLRALLDDLAENPNTTYRVVVRDGNPDSDLAKVLLPVSAADDPETRYAASPPADPSSTQRSFATPNPGRSSSVASPATNFTQRAHAWSSTPPRPQHPSASPRPAPQRPRCCGERPKSSAPDARPTRPEQQKTSRSR